MADGREQAIEGLVQMPPFVISRGPNAAGSHTLDFWLRIEKKQVNLDYSSWRINKGVLTETIV